VRSGSALHDWAVYVFAISTQGLDCNVETYFVPVLEAIRNSFFRRIARISASPSSQSCSKISLPGMRTPPSEALLPSDDGVWSLMLFIYCTFKLTVVLACACGVTALLVAVTVIE
jgi:hypothetical protein